MKIRKDIAELITAGIITQDTAEKIEQYYQDKTGPPQNKIVIIFGILGALLVGLGAILILSNSWDTLSRPFKTVIAFFPLVLGQVICAYTLLRQSNSVTWREASSTFLVVSVGACISMISQIYNVPGEITGFVLVWSLLTLPVVYVMNSSIASLLYIIGITFYACGYGYWDNPVSESYLFWPLLLAVMPHYYMLFRHKNESFVFTFHNWFIPLSLIITLGIVARETEELMFVAYMSLLGLIYLIGQTPPFEQQKILNNGYLSMGSLGTVSVLLALSFDWFWEELRSGEFPPAQLFSTPEFLVSALLTLAALVLLIYQKKKQASLDIKPVETVFILFIGIFILGISSPLAKILINLLILGIGILTIREGARRNHFGILNYGLIIVMALVICRFFDTDISFVIRGILFVMVGAGFFYANYRMVKRKEKGPLSPPINTQANQHNE
jgi:uncharacterized membrane protein